jgi:catechol 2,3-dioxygenase-like lactoylglutathione lyase family enzyme
VKVIALEHVAVTAPEELEEEVISWYEEALGLDPLEKPAGTRSGGGWFRAGDQQVHVSIDEHNPPKTAHFGLVVDDFDDVLARLRELGCHVEQAGGAIPGRKRFYTRDPAGNRIEIITITDA